MLVGRRHELRRITFLLRHGISVAIVGPAGIGKTTLLEAAAGQEGLVGGALATLPWLPYLALRRALQADPPAGDALHVAAWTVECAGGAPLVLDDLQWADVQTLALLQLLRGRLPLLVGIRTGDPGTARALDAVHDAEGIGLQPLSRASAVAIVRGRRPDLEEPALERVLAAAGGNPLLLRELAVADGEPSPTLARSLRARLHRASPPARRAMCALALLGRPAERALVGQGVAELEDAGLVAACGEDVVAIGHELLADAALAAMTAAEQREVHASLAARLSDRGEAARHYAAAGDGQQAFAHALAAVETAAHPAERGSHLALAAEFADRDARNRLRLDAASAYIAGDRPAGAIDVLSALRGAAPVDRAEAALLRARALFALGDCAAAITAASAGLRIVRGSDTHLELKLRIERARARRQAADLRFFREAPDIAALAARVPVEEPGVDLLLGMHLYLIDGSDACIERFRRCRDAARAGGDVALEVDATHLVVGALAAFRRAGEAIAEAQALTARARALRLDAQEATAQWLAARTRLVAQGDLGALPQIEQLRQDPAFGHNDDLARMDHGVALADLGRHAEAEHILDLAAVPAKNPLGVATLLLGAAEARWLVHDMQGALDAAHASLAASASITTPFAALVRAWAQLSLGLPPEPLPAGPFLGGIIEPAAPELRGIASLYARDAAAAEAAFVEAAAGWHGLIARLELRCRWAAGDAAVHRGDLDAAKGHLLAVERDATELGHAALLDRVRHSLRGCGIRRAASRGRGSAGLTARQEAVLALVAQGLTTRDIAARLSLAASTVESILTAARRQLGARTRVEAVALYTGRGPRS
jgi:DNA-binding CsgD family transcriptional regulator